MSDDSDQPPGPPARAAGPPATPELAFLLMALGRRVRGQVDDALTAFDLSYRHLSVLGHLSRDPDLSYSELARRAGVTAQSMQATLRHLEQTGAVQRHSPPGKGRRAQLRVTEVGTLRLRQAMAEVVGVDRRLTERLSAEERRAATEALARLLSSLVDAPADR
ncbi:MarR family winged helix-turn-helix transcriptional regulator [uncultured Friedmanniella sp.]|uniref:MarR family winged helix-turn-helix transcriptional regulator n=1 Tax=uncultured Friedmanniella sp. TaxID=335381 RepID=UPI0035C94A85